MGQTEQTPVSMMQYKYGSVEAQKTGALSKSQLKAFIELNLS